MGHLLICGLLLLGASSSRAGDADSDALYREGASALSQGLPQVAIQKLRSCLAAEPPSEIRRAAAITAARALLASSESAEALALLDQEFPESHDPLPLFWRGQACAALGRWEDALNAYAEVAKAEPSSPLPNLKSEAALGRSEVLLALNRTTEAFQTCKALANDSVVGNRARLRGAEIALDTVHLKEAAQLLLSDPLPGASRSLEKKRTFLIGRLRLAQKQTALAEQIFSTATTRTEGLTERLLAGNFWGWAQACLEQGKLAQAEDVLESFVGAYPRTTYLTGTLNWLEKLYDRNPQLPNLVDLRHWAADATEPLRQAPSLLMLAHVEESLGRPDRAEEVFQSFATIFPEHPLRIRAALGLAALRLREKHLPEAHQALDEARQFATVSTQNEVDMLAARLSLAENESARAAALFEAIAARPGLKGVQAEAAAFNAVLGWLRASETDRFAATEHAFLEQFPGSPFGAELSLEEGLARAARTPLDDRNGRQRAAAALRRFIRENPLHPRAPEARIALAELAFERPHPNLAAAWRELTAPEMRRVENPEGPREANAATAATAGAKPDAPPTASADFQPENDRAAYLAIWLADTPGPSQDTKRAIALANQFLQSRPDSPLAPEVRMKLCEIYFRNEDYSDAQTQLELLVEKTPDSPLVESALYLAGLAASRSMSNAGLDNAVLLFEKTARRNGPFRLPARLRQAELQKRLGNVQDALTLYKDVLTATDSPADLSDTDLESRCAALAGRGEALFLSGAKDAKAYRDAADAFDELANHTPRASLLWRRQALTQKGLALEKSGDTAAALVAYDDALNAADPPDSPAHEPEWTWFYRAGSYAARLLESQSQWQSAIAIYKKLAAADGPLKSDYENLLSRRRLEHYLWEE